MKFTAVVCATVNIALAIENNVLYKLTLVPMKEFPLFLAQLTTFGEVFADFDPIAVAKLSEKKIMVPGSLASSLLSELKLQSIIKSARPVSKDLMDRMLMWCRQQFALPQSTW